MPDIPCEMISWNRFYTLARRLAQQIRNSGFHPDTIVAIGRGGYMPGRVLSDFLGVMDLTGFKIEHYTGSAKHRRAVVRYPLTADLSGKRVLLVDDVNDSGDTFATALDHLQSRGVPVEVRTAVLHHKTVSFYTPDYYVQRIVKWRWLVYPWAVAEDVCTFIHAMQPRPADIEGIAARLAADHGIRLSQELLQDVMVLVEAGNDNNETF